MTSLYDTDKKFYFITGLPRSGSTLLCNLLVQNPRFYSSSTSALLTLLLAMRERWSQLSAMKASDDATAAMRILRGMFYGYFSNTDKPVCFDKGRGWPRHVEMIEEILGHPAKFIVTVRDLRDVLASFEMLWRKNAGHRAIPQELHNYEAFSTVEGRLSVFMDNKEVVGASYNALRDAIQRGFADRLLLVDFNALTSRPSEVMQGIYTFLGEEKFDHNFKYVDQVIHERDTYHGFDDLHTIRPMIQPVESKWREILGEKAGTMYAKLNFWNDPTIVARQRLRVIA